MADELTGLRVAFLTANEGVEQVELTTPWQAVADAGGTPELLAPEAGQVQAFNHLDKADTFSVDQIVAEASDPSFFNVAHRSRPLCPFPQWPHYKGHGDINEAGSFVCSQS